MGERGLVVTKSAWSMHSHWKKHTHTYINPVYVCSHVRIHTSLKAAGNSAREELTLFSIYFSGKEDLVCSCHDCLIISAEFCTSLTIDSLFLSNTACRKDTLLLCSQIVTLHCEDPGLMITIVSFFGVGGKSLCANCREGEKMTD